MTSQMGGTFGSMTKAKFTIIDPANPSTGKLTSFKDVAGMEEAKKEVYAYEQDRLFDSYDTSRR